MGPWIVTWSPSRLVYEVRLFFREGRTAFMPSDDGEQVVIVPPGGEIPPAFVIPESLLLRWPDLHALLDSAAKADQGEHAEMCQRIRQALEAAQ